MIELYREKGFLCQAFEPGPDSGTLSGADGLDVVSLYLGRRAGRDLSSFPAEVFFMGREITSGRECFEEEGERLELSWHFSFPGRPGSRELALLLSLTGSLPALHEMEDPRQWPGGCFALTIDDSWSGSLASCGLDRAEQRRILAFLAASTVSFTLNGETYSSPIMAKAKLNEDGSLFCRFNPLACYALLGFDAQFFLEETADVLEEDFAWTEGLLPLVLSLSELLPVDESGDEADDEFASGSLLALLDGSWQEQMSEEEKKAAAERLMKLVPLVQKLPGWSVQSFEEIADQEDGRSLAAKGERVFRITHTMY